MRHGEERHHRGRRTVLRVSNDERLRAYLHDTLVAGGDVVGLAGRRDRATAQQIVDLVIGDYVAELDRALATGELWRLKLSL